MTDSSSAGHDSTTADRRAAERRPVGGDVAVRVDALELSGGAANVSASGVYFVAGGTVRVRVALPDGAGEREGELMRIESMGGGQLGVAVRFDDPTD